ncbi:hypothetical protein HC928_23175 [bacterium]|nr:hypothetical protein [bacterium]
MPIDAATQPHVMTQSRGQGARLWWLLAAVVLSPSVIVWGSGVLKEPVVLAGLAAVFIWANALAHGERIRFGPLALAAGLIALLAGGSLVALRGPLVLLLMAIGASLCSSIPTR